MPISSNTLIHFTSEKDSLKGILTENFRIKYCKETIFWDALHHSIIHVPMVSFCDIPLSQISRHVESYGCYGLGLTREWAIKNKLNPVLYLESNSNLADSYSKALQVLVKDGHTHEADKQIRDIARYVKNYEGPLTRNGITEPKYRFADEKEWRYVPEIEAACKMLYNVNNFAAKQTEAVASVANLRLAFEPNDVKYIIVKNESEIKEFLNHLDNAKGHKYLSHDLQRLATRIITSEQIEEDF